MVYGWFYLHFGHSKQCTNCTGLSNWPRDLWKNAECQHVPQVSSVFKTSLLKTVRTWQRQCLKPGKEGRPKFTLLKIQWRKANNFIFELYVWRSKFSLQETVWSVHSQQIKLLTGRLQNMSNRVLLVAKANKSTEWYCKFREPDISESLTKWHSGLPQSFSFCTNFMRNWRQVVTRLLSPTLLLVMPQEFYKTFQHLGRHSYNRLLKPRLDKIQQIIQRIEREGAGWTLLRTRQCISPELSLHPANNNTDHWSLATS